MSRYNPAAPGILISRTRPTPVRNDTSWYQLIQLNKVSRIQELTLNPRVRGSSPGAAPVMTDLSAARRLFTRALHAGTVPVEVATDRAPAYPHVPDELVPSALHTVEQHANNPTEADHGGSRHGRGRRPG
jgi:hypothetical protein